MDTPTTIGAAAGAILMLVGLIDTLIRGTDRPTPRNLMWAVKILPSMRYFIAKPDVPVEHRHHR